MASNCVDSRRRQSSSCNDDICQMAANQQCRTRAHLPRVSRARFTDRRVRIKIQISPLKLDPANEGNAARLRCYKVRHNAMPAEWAWSPRRIVSFQA